LKTSAQEFLMTGFPQQPNQVTPGWLTSALQLSGALPKDRRVTGFDLEPVGEGVGMLGVIARLTLQFDAPVPAGTPTSVVAKCATPTLANREVAKSFRVYEREVRFFRDLAGGIDAGIPACHAAEFDDETHDFILVLEDLGHLRQGDQVAGCGLTDAQAGVDAMAKLHAAWWNAPSHIALDWVPRVNGDLHKPAMLGGFEAGRDPAVAIFGDQMDPKLKASIGRYQEGLAGLHDRMASGPQTLVHGDFRLDNLLFGNDPTDPPIALLDWQGLLVSNGTQDLAYFLSQNVVTDVRRAHERELIARYHAGLVAGGVTSYSATDAWADYELSVLYMFEYAIVIGGTLDPSNERGAAFMTGLINRSSTAIIDLDLLRLLPG
jgi:hypothetical protein